MTLKQLIWKNLLKWWKRLAILAAILALLWGSCGAGVLTANRCGSLGLNIAVVLYMLALPVSVLFRLDQVALQLGSQNSIAMQAVGLAYVFVNISMFAALGACLKRLKAGKEPEKKAPPPKEASQPKNPVPTNGTKH